MTSRKAFIEIAAKDNASHALSRLRLENARLEKQIRSSTAANDSFNRSVNAGRNAMRGSRGQLGQMSYQIQDIAVQLQGGQNAMLVFTQQGSQMASVFGPTGIVVGAILAVGGALGTALLPSLFETTDSMEELERVTKLLDDTFDDLDDRTRVLTDRMKALYETNKQAFQVELLASYKDAADGAALAIKTIMEAVDESSSGSIQAIVELQNEMNNVGSEMVSRSSNYYSRRLVEAAEEASDALGLTNAQALQLADKFRLLEEGKITPDDFQSTLDNMVHMNTVTAEFASEIRESTDAWGDHKEAINEIQALLDGLKEPEFTSDDAGNNGSNDDRLTRDMARRVQAMQEIVNQRRYSSQSELQAIRQFEAEREAIEHAANMKSANAMQERLNQRRFTSQTELEILRQLDDQQQVLHDAEMARIKELRDARIAASLEFSAAASGLFAQLASSKQSALADEVRNAKNMSAEEIAQREAAAKEAFEAEKKWALAGVAFNTGVAAMKALATEDPFTKWASFAAVMATGATQAAAIQSRTFNSGAFNSGGGSPAPIQNTTNNQSINNNVTITGGVGFGIAELQELFDNDNVIIQPDSAQARAILNG